MSKKIYIGIIAGALVGISVSVLLKLRKEEYLFSEEDLSDENDLLGKANRYLSAAKKKAGLMLDEAEEKSNSILENAANILQLAKDKTSSIHYDVKEIAEEEVNKIKTEIDESIKKYKKESGY